MFKEVKWFVQAHAFFQQISWAPLWTEVGKQKHDPCPWGAYHLVEAYRNTKEWAKSTAVMGDRRVLRTPAMERAWPALRMRDKGVGSWADLERRERRVFQEWRAGTNAQGMVSAAVAQELHIFSGVGGSRAELALMGRALCAKRKSRAGSSGSYWKVQSTEVTQSDAHWVKMTLAS